MNRRLTIAGLLLLMCTASLLARQGTIRTKDGRTIEGDITERADGNVTIAMRAGSITLRKDDIDSISYSQDINAQYQERLAKLKNPTAKDHLDIARWLYEHRAYEQARNEVDAALRLDPNNAEAVTLRRTIETNMNWNRNRPSPQGRDPGPGTRDPGPGTREPGPAGRDPGAARMLDADQINIIRQKEIQDGDTQIRVRFEGDVQRRLAERLNLSPRDFASLSDYDKVMAAIRSGTPDMLSGVRINTDPNSVRAFKTRIQPVILGGCAAAGCHNAKYEGDFKLHSPATGDPATSTNFYILTQYAAQVGTSDAAAAPGASTSPRVARMINRTQPDRSVLAQFGLPRDIADFDHPDTPNWKPAFRNLQDPKYLDLVTWIGRGLSPIEPNYGINFPVGGANPEQAVSAPPATATPAAAPANPPSNQNPPPRDDARNKADEARDRIRPVTPNIPRPVIPF